MNFDLSRRLAAEALGTFFLVMAVVGSGIMAAKLAGGNEAIALLCNTLATGAVLVVIITIFVSVSGAHFNPAVTLVMLLRGNIETRRGACLCGGADRGRVSRRGSGASHVRPRPVQLGSTARTGFGQWLGEFIATFGLIATILGCVRFRPGALAAAVGLYIGSAYWFTSIHLFRQSGRDHRPRAQRHVCGNSRRATRRASSWPSFSARSPALIVRLAIR